MNVSIIKYLTIVYIRINNPCHNYNSGNTFYEPCTITSKESMHACSCILQESYNLTD